jgi:hypothetical protein
MMSTKLPSKALFVPEPQMLNLCRVNFATAIFLKIFPLHTIGKPAKRASVLVFTFHITTKSLYKVINLGILTNFILQ